MMLAERWSWLVGKAVAKFVREKMIICQRSTVSETMSEEAPLRVLT